MGWIRIIRKILIALIFIFLLFFIAANTNRDNDLTDKEEEITGIFFDETFFNLEVAKNSESHRLGLSYRDSLDSQAGMFFEYKTKGVYGFWMKGMNFPIDIIWFDENLTIVHIEKEISPDTYPQSFFPIKPALYVLEINAGLSDKYDIKVGDRASFKY